MNRWYFRLLTILILGLISVPNISLELGPARLRPVDLIVICITVLSFIHSPRYTLTKFDVRLLLPLLGMFGYGIVLLNFQPYPVSNSIVDLIELFETIVLYISLRHLFKEGGVSLLNNLFYIVSVWTAISSVVGVLFYITTGVRLVYVPYVVGLPAFSTFYMVSMYFQTQKWRYLAFSVVIILRIIFTQSRSIWIGMVGAVLILLLIDRQEAFSSIRTQLPTVIVSIGMSLMSTLLLFPALIDRVLSLVRGNQFLFARPVIYVSGLQYLAEYPLGVGLGNFTAAIQKGAVNGTLWFPSWFRHITGEGIIDYMLEQIAAGTMGSHSDLVRFFVELGPVGGLLFILFWAVILRLIVITDRHALSNSLRLALLYFGIQSVINAYLLVRGDGFLIVLVLVALVTLNETDDLQMFSVNRDST